MSTSSQPCVGSAQSSESLQGTGPIFGPMLAVALATVVTMWTAWVLTHVPLWGWTASPEITGPVLISIMAVALTLGLSRVPASKGLVVGLGAGVITSAINLLALGSMLTEPTGSASTLTSAAPGAEGLKPNAALMAGGFLALGAVVGAVAGLVGSAIARKRSTKVYAPSVWLGRIALIASLSIIPMLTLGGMVTSTASGLAVPDWPGTYGANMFLYPISLMAQDARVFLEHSHRLYGAMLGVITILMTLYTFVATKNKPDAKGIRLMACTVLGLVIIQGIMGGIRVRYGFNDGSKAGQYFAFLHGVLAQFYFAASVLMSTWALSRSRQERGIVGGVAPTSDEVPMKALKTLRTLMMVLVGAVVIQLLFGALYRHTRAPHPLWSHVGFSIVVVVMAMAGGALLTKNAGSSRGFMRVGKSLFHTVGLQFVLGWVAFFLIDWTKNKVEIPKAQEIVANQVADLSRGDAVSGLVRTIHQVNGAVLLALAVLGLALVWRRYSTRLNAGTAVGTP
ncbi:MAG: COX15/CtaA family protein [Phycisphaerales bacterium]|nr:COX15/CtaA family protein [Phycisphaerales bacterium]